MKKRFLVLSTLSLATACAAAPPRPAPPVAVAAPVPATPGSPEDDAGVPVGPSDPTWGSRTAPVTIVEFADLQCPFCARVVPTLARVRETFGPNRVRIVWKSSPLPFHANARPAAEAGAGVFALAGSDAFWGFLELAFDHPGQLSEDGYVSWANLAGVHDGAAFRAGLDAHTWGPKVDADLAEAQQLGVQGTPSFYINGVQLVGAQPFEAFASLIEAQELEAQSKIAAGIPADRVYAILSKQNFTAPPPEKDDEKEPDEDTKTVFKVALGKSPARGPATALVTVVEFADFECPFCVRVEPTLRELSADYGDKIRFVFKNEPLSFHKRAEPAAEAALEVRAEKGDAAFWSMHDAMFEEARDLSDDGLVAAAVRFGASAEKVKAAVAKHTHKAEIDADEDEASDFQANGTPHFFINGRRLVGAQPKARFAAIIDEEVKKAQAIVDGGAKANTVYDALTKDGQGAPEPDRVGVDGLPAGDPAKGPATAKVTLHEFADFQCPFCVRAEGPLREVAKAYGDKVRFVWHDLPLSFHENAMPAARAAREARKQRGDAAFWQFHDRVFGDGSSTTSKVSRPELDEAAKALGLDMTQWAAALDGDAHKSEVEADAAAAEKIGFNGTPSFVVVAAGAAQGYVIEGAQDFAAFRRIIQRALAEAKR
ncbi:MAG TPA: thioredoxin domain-containing protein [Polyangiaceae bacterium]|jgi:protein-disulfide isomerase|nr:thioredoxin domain-containing protein [Polyangiaceae bacterium]